MSRLLLALALTLPLALLSGDEPNPSADGEPADVEEEVRPATILYTLHNVGYIEPCG